MQMTRIQLASVFAFCAGVALGQNADLSGLIQDPSHSGVSGAEVTIRNEQTGGRRNTRSNASGFYSLPALSPSLYRLSIRAVGFETIVREGIKLEVGENARMDFSLRLGDFRTEVTVHGDSPLINSENASVGTVIDRDTIDQMPLNGRGIQALIELSPRVVAVPVTGADLGQFAINGQRTDANYFTVDGVSANFALMRPLPPIAPGSPLPYQAGGAMIPANNFLGTFSNLVSPEALQEFRIQTSPASRVEMPVGLKSQREPRSEREIIESALAESRGRVSGPSGAAVKLGMSPSTLEDSIKALKIDKRRFKYS